MQYELYCMYHAVIIWRYKNKYNKTTMLLVVTPVTPVRWEIYISIKLSVKVT